VAFLGCRLSSPLLPLSPWGSTRLQLPLRDFAHLSNITSGDRQHGHGIARSLATRAGSSNTASGYQALLSTRRGKPTPARAFVAPDQFEWHSRQYCQMAKGRCLITPLAAATCRGPACAFKQQNRSKTRQPALVPSQTKRWPTLIKRMAFCALGNTQSASKNTATGFNALLNNTTGGHNTGQGFNALPKKQPRGNNTRHRTGGAGNQVPHGESH